MSFSEEGFEWRSEIHGEPQESEKNTRKKLTKKKSVKFG